MNIQEVMERHRQEEEERRFKADERRRNLTAQLSFQQARTEIKQILASRAVEEIRSHGFSKAATLTHFKKQA